MHSRVRLKRMVCTRVIKAASHGSVGIDLGEKVTTFIGKLILKAASIRINLGNIQEA